MDEKNNFALVRRPLNAVEKAAPGAKRVLAGMVAETLALAEAKALIEFLPNNSPLLESWCQKGESYYDGRGVPQDYAEAAKWFRMAAEKGHAGAQCSLGELFQIGEGVVQNFDEAFAWYQKSAEQGNMWGQYSLGECHLNGFGVSENYNEAAKWFRKAAEQGHVWSQLHLGDHYFYEGGDGVPQDYGEAVRWYHKAAEQNLHNAQRALAICFLDGLGVEKDLITAFQWFKIAADQDDILAENKLALLRSSLTEEQIAEGERRCREFLSSKHLIK